MRVLITLALLAGCAPHRSPSPGERLPGEGGTLEVVDGCVVLGDDAITVCGDWQPGPTLILEGPARLRLGEVWHPLRDASLLADPEAATIDGTASSRFPTVGRWTGAESDWVSVEVLAGLRWRLPDPIGAAPIGARPAVALKGAGLGYTHSGDTFIATDHGVVIEPETGQVHAFGRDAWSADAAAVFALFGATHDQAEVTLRRRGAITLDAAWLDGTLHVGASASGQGALRVDYPAGAVTVADATVALDDGVSFEGTGAALPGRPLFELASSRVVGDAAQATIAFTGAIGGLPVKRGQLTLGPDLVVTADTLPSPALQAVRLTGGHDAKGRLRIEGQGAVFACGVAVRDAEVRLDDDALWGRGSALLAGLGVARLSGPITPLVARWSGRGDLAAHGVTLAGARVRCAGDGARISGDARFEHGSAQLTGTSAARYALHGPARVVIGGIERSGTLGLTTAGAWLTAQVTVGGGRTQVAGPLASTLRGAITTHIAGFPLTADVEAQPGGSIRADGTVTLPNLGEAQVAGAAPTLAGRATVTLHGQVLRDGHLRMDALGARLTGDFMYAGLDFEVVGPVAADGSYRLEALRPVRVEHLVDAEAVLVVTPGGIEAIVRGEIEIFRFEARFEARLEPDGRVCTPVGCGQVE